MAVPNVTYNIDVKSKFAFFMDDDLCEAEPEELVRKVNEEKKRREKEAKDAKKKEKMIKGKSVESHVKEEQKVTKVGNESVVKKNESGVKKNDFGVKKNDSGVKKNDSGVKKEVKMVESAVVNVEKSHGKSEKSHGKSESGVHEEEASDDKERSNKGKKSFVTGGKTRGREFDRHSGSDKTGVKAVERRDGSGSYNWGNVLDVVELPTFSEPKDDLIEEKINTIESDEKTESEKPAMTISEWKALHSNDNIKSSHAPTRPANNGENVFTGMNAYQKKNIHLNESDNEVVVPEDDTDSKGRRQIKLNIEFSGRARRGGARSGFNNSRFKNDANKESNKDSVVINLDEEEFPTLS